MPIRRIASLLVVCVTGCAFSLSGPDPQRAPNKFPECDTSKSLVVLDGVMATALGVTALSVVANSSEPAIALLPLAVGALYLGGAVSGNSSVNKCHAAIQEFTGSYEREGFANLDETEEPTRRDARRGPTTVGPLAGGGATQPPGQELPSQTPPMQAPTQAPMQPPPPITPPPGTQPVPAHAAQPPSAQRPAAPPQPRQPPPAPKPAPATDDDWSEFWQEVP
jgi:hypothetical protein